MWLKSNANQYLLKIKHLSILRYVLHELLWFEETCVVTTAIICNVPLCLRYDPLSSQAAYVVNPVGYVETFGTKIQPHYHTALSEDTLLQFLSLSIYRNHPENFEICTFNTKIERKSYI